MLSLLCSQVGVCLSSYIAPPPVLQSCHWTDPSTGLHSTTVPQWRGQREHQHCHSNRSRQISDHMWWISFHVLVSHASCLLTGECGVAYKMRFLAWLVTSNVKSDGSGHSSVVAFPYTMNFLTMLIVCVLLVISACTDVVLNKSL